MWIIYASASGHASGREQIETRVRFPAATVNLKPTVAVGLRMCKLPWLIGTRFPQGHTGVGDWRASSKNLTFHSIVGMRQSYINQKDGNQRSTSASRHILLPFGIEYARKL